MPYFVGPLLGQRPQPRVRRHSAADAPASRRPASRQAASALLVSTSQTASWKDAATSATGTGSPARCRASTQRATAVFSPENEKSNRWAARSFGGGQAAREGDRRPASPARASRSMGGPPGNGSPSSRATLSNASPAASSMVAPSGVTPRARSSTSSRRRVAAGDQQRDRGLGQRAVLQGVHRDVRGEVVDAVDRFLGGERVPLGGGDPDQQRAGQPGPGGDRDRVDVGQRDPGVVEGPVAWSARWPPGGPGWPPPAPPRRTGRAPRRWRRARRRAGCARARSRRRSRRRRSRSRGSAVRQPCRVVRPRSARRRACMTSASVLLGW